MQSNCRGCSNKLMESERVLGLCLICEVKILRKEVRHVGQERDTAKAELFFARLENGRLKMKRLRLVRT